MSPLQQLISDILQWFVQLGRKAAPLEGYSKTKEFKARGGAWFMIVFCIAELVFLAYLIIAQPFVEHDGFDFLDLLGHIIFYCLPVLFILLLRHSISMRKARIVVGPEMLVLDGALEETPRRKRWSWLYTSDLVVEIPWDDVYLIDDESFQLHVETKSHNRYMMPLGYFGINVTWEISKYHKLRDI